jgi:REP element-mobilizing transposase RayT
MARGIERRNIFVEKEDYADFLTRLEISVKKNPCRIFAWALMPNHFHLLIRSGKDGLVPVMKRVMTGYAVGFNIRHRRVGHLFQNRYKSIICEEEPYLLELVRYIHLNPYRAGLVRGLEQLKAFPYTGHGALLGGRKFSWQDTDEVLERFSRHLPAARCGYEKFVREGLSQKERADLMGGGLIRSMGGIQIALQSSRSNNREAYDSRILGTGSFVEKVLKTVEDSAAAEPRMLKRGIDVKQVAERIAQQRGIERRYLFQKNRTDAVSQAKALLIHVGVEYLGKSNREMALLTKMSDPAASRARERGEVIFRGSEWEDWLQVN